MTVGTITITIRVRVAWWVRPYLWVMARLPLITRRQPDMQKVQRRILSGIRPVVRK